MHPCLVSSAWRKVPKDLILLNLFSKSWRKTAEPLTKFNVTQPRRRAGILDERTRIQMSLDGLEQWTETSKIKLTRAAEFSVPSEIPVA